MNCKQCKYLETEIDCGEKVVYCSAVPEEYPAGCWKIEWKEQDDED